MKVSFDFDETLDKPYIQEYAKHLLSKGVEVWIVTSRYPSHQHPDFPEWNNDDLFEVADKVGITPDRIVFTSWAEKWRYLKDKDFVWHLDDCPFEIKGILLKTKVKAISVETGSWKQKCNRLLWKNTLGQRKVN